MGLLDAIRRVGRRRAPAPPSLTLEGRRVLLVYLFPALGDAVLLAPIVRALLEHGARRPVGLLLRENGARIWRHVDLPVKIHVLPDRLATHAEPEDDAGAAEVLKLHVGIRKSAYDIAVDLTARDDVDARRWLDRAEVSVRLGYLRPEEKSAESLTWATPDERHQALEHWTQYLAAPLAPFELGPLPDHVDFTVPASAEAKAEALWGRSPRVLLIPGAQSPEKRFAARSFAAAGRLGIERGGSAVVAGAPGEKDLVTQVAAAVGPRARAYIGRGLGPLVHLVRSSDAVVTNDTGPMHLAFLSGRPTVAVFTSMSAPCWGPIDPGDPRFVTLSVPAGAADAVVPVVERMMLERLHTLLNAS